MSAATSLEFNPLVSPHLEDPYPLLDRLRREAPVVHNPLFDLWFVTGHDEVVAVLKDPARFSSADILKPQHALSPEIAAVLEGADPGVYPLLSCDPPLHTRVRNLVARAFRPPRIAALEPRIRAIAEGLVEGFAAAGEVDVIERFAYPLPMRLTSEMFAIPAADVDRIKAFCDDETLFMMAPLEAEHRLQCARSVAAYRRYLRALVDERRASPGDDLVSELLAARIDGETPLTTEEIVGVLCVLIFAGHETATNMIGNTLRILLQRPGTWQTLREDPGLIPGALEEALRFDPPVQGMTRTVTEETELGGVRLPKGARVLLHFGAANRDPACAEDPARFDLQRSPQPTHLAFGRGGHFCVGALLARLEGRIALEVLTQKLPNARLTSDEPPPYAPNFVHRGPKALRIAWDVAGQVL
jgi:cytochrome P450